MTCPESGTRLALFTEAFRLPMNALSQIFRPFSVFNPPRGCNSELAQHIRPAHSLEDECLQLVNWAVEHMWADREFLRVAIPRALLDPSFGQVLRRVGPLQMARALAARLRKFRECRALPDADLHALAQFVTVMGFMFGFMRPAVLRQDRKTAANIAATIAKLLVRGLPSGRAIPQPAPSLTQTPTGLQSSP